MFLHTACMGLYSKWSSKRCAVLSEGFIFSQQNQQAFKHRASESHSNQSQATPSLKLCRLESGAEFRSCRSNRLSVVSSAEHEGKMFLDLSLSHQPKCKGSETPQSCRQSMHPMFKKIPVPRHCGPSPSTNPAKPEWHPSLLTRDFPSAST